MRITGDPSHPAYRDEADVRDELTRVFDICTGCRQCVDRCDVFPALFTLTDRLGGAGEMTPAQQDRLVDQCFHCSLCAVDCPYAAERDERAVDVPRLMLRALAMRRAAGQLPVRQLAFTAFAAAVLAGGERPRRMRRSGRAAVRLLPSRLPTRVFNMAVAAPPGSARRRVVQWITGVSAARLIPRRTSPTFSTWFRRRPARGPGVGHTQIGLFPTCTVEHHDVALGQAAVAVLERNGVECTLVGGSGCCGAPWLLAGDVDTFTATARRTVGGLAGIVRSGRDIVVLQPTCSAVLRTEYPRHLPGDDAVIVAAHTFEVSDYLMRRQDAASTASGRGLDTHFPGEVSARVSYHAPCHLRRGGDHLAGRDLVALTGAAVEVVGGCSGRCAAWGLHADHAAASTRLAGRLAGRLADALVDRLVDPLVDPLVDRAAERHGVVVASCPDARIAVAEQRRAIAVHPVQLLARAYGVGDGSHPRG